MEYQLKAMDMWFRTLPGALVADLELKELNRLLPTIPGQLAVQVGGPANLHLLHKTRMRHVYYCTDQPSWHSDGTRVQCCYQLLPFESDSIHLIVLTHVLEFAENPKQLLEEVYRVLAPGGQLIVLGFNRWSGWSVTRRCRKQKGYPWSGCFYSIWQVKSWLNCLDYGLIANKSFCFIPPLQTRPLAKWVNLLEVLGQLFIPKMGAVHLVYAQKKVAGTTPLRNLWTKKPKAAYRVVAETRQVICQGVCVCRGLTNDQDVEVR